MIEKIGVIGAGTMGRGIAQVAASAGHEVLIYDTSPESRINARDALMRILNRLVEKGKLDDATAKSIFGRIYFLDTKSALSEAGLIIEAIVENLEVKQQLFRKLEDIVTDDCVLATNTSSLSIASIASVCQSPQRVIGMHFFNPAPLMRLVELIPGIRTVESITGKCRQLMENWQKTAVLVKDTPGFIVNRVARPFYGEALRIYDEGIADFATIDWAMTELGNFRMGPFALMDYIGNDVNLAVTESVYKAFYHDPRYRPSFTQKRLVEAGMLGRKSGKGYYDYQMENPERQPDKDENRGKVILDRIQLMLINEAADVLFWGIASRDDIDLAMTMGVNYPVGLLRLADQKGIDNCVRSMDALYDCYHDGRYRCSPILRKMAKEGQTFYS
jgi:3-hydroxybutyryl-CoA dehydrogenase